MGRWRPPAEKSAPYITPKGFAELSEELRILWREKRPAVTQALSEAAAEGDRSENAEYIYRKKELRELDRRIRYLSKRIDQLKIVDRIPDDPSKVFFGAWVRLIDQDEQVREFRILGADEIDPAKGYISIDSPLAKQLLKRSEGEVVQVDTVNGAVEYEIDQIRYEEK